MDFLVHMQNLYRGVDFYLFFFCIRPQNPPSLTKKFPEFYMLDWENHRHC